MCSRTEMAGVREYSEEMPVLLLEAEGRRVIEARNEGGFNCTLVDLLDLVDWLKRNRPNLLQ